MVAQGLNNVLSSKAQASHIHISQEMSWAFPDAQLCPLASTTNVHMLTTRVSSDSQTTFIQ